jgi:transcriptional regulator NrdR family protein
VNCPVCSHDSRVLKTTDTERRRECLRCGHRFTTTEILKDEQDRREALIRDARALAERLAV